MAQQSEIPTPTKGAGQMYHVAIGDSVNVWTDNADAAWSAFNNAIHSHIRAVIRRDGVVLDSFAARGTR